MYGSRRSIADGRLALPPAGDAREFHVLPARYPCLVGIAFPPVTCAEFDATANLALLAGDRLDLLRTLPAGAARLVVSSPPYNVGKSYEAALSTEEYVAAQEATLTECVRVLSDDGSLCWQVFDGKGKPVGSPGSLKAGIPTWSLPAAASRPDGSFVILH